MSSRPRVPGADGQSLVEFALVFPVFLLLLFGLIDIGRFVYATNAVSEAAREGARLGSVAGDCSGDRVKCVKAETIGRLAGVAGATAEVTCSRFEPTTKKPSSLVPVVGECRTNDLLTVKVTAPFQVLTPLFGQLLSGSMIGGSSTVAVNQ